MCTGNFSIDGGAGVLQEGVSVGPVAGGSKKGIASAFRLSFFTIVIPFLSLRCRAESFCSVRISLSQRSELRK